MDKILNCFLPPLLFFLGYLSLSTIFYIIDIYILNKSEHVQKYKIQKKKAVNDEYRKVLPIVFRNLTVTTIMNMIACLLIFKYIPIQNINNKWSNFEIIKLGMGMLIHELIFSAFHILFHKIPFLYKTIHKKHHKITNPFAISALYMSLTEAILITTICTQIPNLIFRYNHITMCMYVMITLLFFISSHSGYGKYTLITNSRHDLHHKYYNVNYSNIEYIDKILGTNKTND